MSNASSESLTTSCQVYPDSRLMLCCRRSRVTKRRHGLNRCRYKGDAGMKRWVGLGVIAAQWNNSPTSRFLTSEFGTYAPDGHHRRVLLCAFSGRQSGKMILRRKVALDRKSATPGRSLKALEAVQNAWYHELTLYEGSVWSVRRVPVRRPDGGRAGKSARGHRCR
jgi:hypothetical protein